MSGSGIRRKIDRLGRVVIPSPIRQQLDIAEGDELEVSVEGDRVVLARPSDGCLFCDGREHLERYRSKQVCWSCMAAIRALDRERTGDAVGRFGS
jgi:AbrB family transcriptional regulator, transcriptional pleiotropic regulator of transition state genes